MKLTIQMPSSTSLMPTRWPASVYEMLLLAVHADATASGHEGIAIVQRVGQVGQANIRSR